MTLAKICGLSTPETVQAALDGRAAYLGFMFVARSTRLVAPDAAARLAGPARGKARIVAVVMDPSDALLDSLVAALKPDFIQLHGQEAPGRVRDIARRTGVGVIKVLSVAEASDLDPAADYELVADHLMLDAKVAGAALPGGQGVSFDWDLLAGQRFAKPWFLAGGLDPFNVSAAVSRSRAPIVDVSSGVERGPGIKDPALIAAFLDAVHRT